MLCDLDLPTALDTRTALHLRTASVTLRRATTADLPELMALLADDAVSASRGDTGAAEDASAYSRALEEIVADPGNDLLVAVDSDLRLVGTLQLTRIPGMARQGATRLLVEAVRVSSDARSAGIGSALMRWVTDVAAPALGSSLVQLTSDAARVDAHRFYDRLGFVASHVGFKYAVR
jgi:GNAT superfamily N-acetyltransferase